MWFLFLLLAVSVCADDVGFFYEKNREDHHTVDYKISSDVLPLRRSQTFAIEYENESNTSVTFILSPVADLKGTPLRKQPNANQIKIPIGSGPTTKWGAWTVRGDIRLIQIPSDAPIGIYQFGVSTDTVTFSDTLIVILCNPWSQNDVVSMPDEDKRHEYVESQDGAMWTSIGSGPRGWTWDQFEEDTLAVTLSFLNALPDFNDRSDLVKMSRHLSAYMNINDDNGLLWGQWSEPYTGGKEPWEWDGSGAIFSQFRTTKKPVKYGQCWVFAGVLVSACRSLGIPARQITNFNSAHEDETPYRLTIDFFSDEDGNPISWKTRGSIWNFHAWSEAWFERSDLENASGWQVIDATPQERSDGIFQLGPASKAHIQGKILNSSYDTDFVASEAYAAVRQYSKFKTGGEEHPFEKGFYLAEENLNHIGKQMSTKAVNSLNRHDVTSEYKPVKPTDSDDHSHRVVLQSRPHVKDEIAFRVESTGAVLMGEDLNVALYVTCTSCTSRNNRTVHVAYAFEMLTYWGKILHKISDNMTSLVISDSRTKTLSLKVSLEEYQNYLADANYIQSHIFAKVYRGSNFTGSYFSQVKRYDVVADVLDVRAYNITDNSFLLDVAMKNPLSIPLTNAVVAISGAHIENDRISFPKIDRQLQIKGHLVHVTGNNARNLSYAFVKMYCDQVSFFEGEVVVSRGRR